MNVKKIIRWLLPESFFEYRRRLLRKKMWNCNAGRSAGDVFAEIYSKNLWGGTAGELCSGTGSSGPVADAYCDMVNHFVKQHGINSIVDIGCGDFKIGRKIASGVQSYVGIDVVSDVVEFNSTNYGCDNVQFQCLDAAKDQLPKAELCLVRQVFQHLSNQQILAITEKFKNYKYIMVTEHYPPMTQDFVANKDKPHGADTRVCYGSAVVLDAPPYNISTVELVLSVPAVDCLLNNGELINTYLLSGSELMENSHTR